MKLLVSIIFFLAALVSYGQKTSPRKQTADSLSAEKIQLVNAFLNLSPLDSIADIGTGSGYSLIPIANECPGCRFTVEDVDSITCNRKALQKRILKSGSRTGIDKFTFFYGTEKNTNLPSMAYNKILVFDVIHEMTYKKEMLGDIKRILQKNGSIFIEEILVHKTVKKDKVCNYPFLREAAFKQLLLENSLVIKREKITFDTGNNKYIKIFECTPTD